MSKRWVLFGVIAVVTACGSSPEGEAPEPPAPPRVYAYTTIHFGQSVLETTGDLILMDGTEELGRTPTGGLGANPTFTTDGRHAFSLAGDGLVTIAVATGKVTKIPCDECWDRTLECQCQTVVPFGAGTVAWLDSANRLVRTDLAAEKPGPEPTATTAPTWPTEYGVEVAPQLIAGTEDTVLVAYPRAPYGEPGPLYLAGPGGQPRQLTTDRSTPVEEGLFSPDGSELALYGAPESNVCATVTVVDLASGAAATTPVATSDPCTTRDGFVGTMWWDPDGTLNGYFQPDDRQTTLVGATQHTLTGEQWARTDVDTATQVHQLSGNATAVLSHPGVRDEDTLYVEIDGKRTRVEREVNGVVAAPR